MASGDDQSGSGLYGPANSTTRPAPAAMRTGPVRSSSGGGAVRVSSSSRAPRPAASSPATGLTISRPLKWRASSVTTPISRSPANTGPPDMPAHADRSSPAGDGWRSRGDADCTDKSSWPLLNSRVTYPSADSLPRTPSGQAFAQGNPTATAATGSVATRRSSRRPHPTPLVTAAHGRPATASNAPSHDASDQTTEASSHCADPSGRTSQDLAPGAMTCPAVSTSRSVTA